MSGKLLRQMWDYFTIVLSEPQKVLFTTHELSYPYRQKRIRKILAIFGLDKRHLLYEKGRSEFVFFKTDKSIRVLINRHFIQVQFTGVFWTHERANDKFFNYLQRLKAEYGIEKLRLSRIDISSDVALPVESLFKLKKGYRLKGKSKAMIFTQFLNPQTFDIESVGFKNSRMSFLVYNKINEIQKSKNPQKIKYYSNLFAGEETVSRVEIRLLKDRSKTFQQDILMAQSAGELERVQNKILEFFFSYYQLESEKGPAFCWKRQKKAVLGK